MMAMDMEGVRSSIAALLFLTLVALIAAASAGGGGDDAAAAVEEQQCHPLADDEPYMQLGALANTMAAADDDEEQAAGYMLVSMQTGGGDKIRLAVVADQRYFFITGYAKGFSSRPRWSFRDGERHRLLPSGSSNGSSSHGSSSGSHAEVVASNVLRALMNAGSSCA
jgi:hypothetical protein